MTPWIATVLLASATWTAPASPPADTAAGTAPPDFAEIIAIPPALRAQLQERVKRTGATDRDRLYELVDFIFDRNGFALAYDDTKTRTVEEVYQSRKANCLSFTLLFLALSRDAGFDTRAQEVGQALAWHEDADTFYTSGHVNAGLRIDGARWTADLDRSLAYAPHGPKIIDDQRLLAHFYNNRGVELMAQGQRDAGAMYLQQALIVAPDLADAWNSLGVLRLRNGDVAAAATMFKGALDVDRSYAAALTNLVTLYRHSGDVRSKDLYLHRLRRAQSRDPFLQFILANEAERSDRYDEAVYHYRRAIRLYDDAHQFHFGLAQTYYRMGKTGMARRELNRALELGRGDDALERRYAAKLASLQAWTRQQSTTPTERRARMLR